METTRPRRNRPAQGFLVATAVVAVLAVAAGCGSDSVATPSDPVLARGQEIHQTRCAACHGIRGQGGTGKKLNDGLILQNRPTVEDHRAVVTEGLKGTAMVPFKDSLTPADIDAVVRYQREVLAKIAE